MNYFSVIYNNFVIHVFQIDRELKHTLKKTLKDSYTGDKGTDSVTKAWNYVFFTVCIRMYYLLL